MIEPDLAGKPQESTEMMLRQGNPWSSSNSYATQRSPSKAGLLVNWRVFRRRSLPSGRSRVRSFSVEIRLIKVAALDISIQRKSGELRGSLRMNMKIIRSQSLHVSGVAAQGQGRFRDLGGEETIIHPRAPETLSRFVSGLRYSPIYLVTGRSHV